MKYSDGEPIARIGDLYIVGIDPMTEISIIRNDGCITGFINMRQLDRLQNGNYATPVDTFLMYKRQYAYKMNQQMGINHDK